jgi:hypothetical protein
MDLLIKEIDELNLKIQELEQLREVKQQQLIDLKKKMIEEELSRISSSEEEIGDLGLYLSDLFTEELPITDAVRWLQNHYSDSRRQYERRTSPLPQYGPDPELFSRCKINPIIEELESLLTRDIKSKMMKEGYGRGGGKKKLTRRNIYKKNLKKKKKRKRTSKIR